MRTNRVLSALVALLLTLVCTVSVVTPALAATPNRNGTTGLGSTVDSEAKAVLDQVGWNFEAAYNWCVKNIKYTKHVPTDDDKTPVAEFAKYGFENKKGNCYCFAACLYAMGKLLGEDIHVVYGTVPYREGGSGPHAWNELKRNGTKYVCDAEFEQESKQKGKSYTNGYLFTYGTKGSWKYSDIRQIL